MKVGFNLDRSGLDCAKIIELSQLAESLGYDSVSLYDHLYSMRDPNEVCLEAWALLPHIAAKTSRVRILTLVSNNLLRHPGVLTKMASSVDILSGGRLIFGIGAGWYRKEAVDFGINFPDTKTRLGMLDESVQVILKLWTEDSANFEGKYYRLKNAESLPKPLQKPHPPVLVGGKGENVLLKIVAKYADMSNFFMSDCLTPEKCDRLLQALQKHCDQVGRDYGSIKKSIAGLCVISRESSLDEYARKEGMSLQDYKKYLESMAIWGTADEVAMKLKEYEKKGIDYAFLRFPRDSQDKMAKLFAEEVVPSIS
ncbi:MAG: TIGR03560 family F420-dependent LLM class oxidoreductase [Nitrososphaerales archaeon]